MADLRPTADRRLDLILLHEPMNLHGDVQKSGSSNMDPKLDPPN